MKYLSVGFSLLVVLFPTSLFCQETSLSDPNEGINKKTLSGFVRGGLYGAIDNADNRIYIPGAFSDVALKLEFENSKLFKAFTDIRFRYGTEFLTPVNNFSIREAYATVKGKEWDITAGQQIVKWGKADFTNPTSKLSSRNLISRSPDPEDMDLGNLMAKGRWFPSTAVTFEAIAAPYYKPSTLLIGPLELPSYVTIITPPVLITGKEMLSYGFKTEAHLNGADLSVSFFDGYDPMPGTGLSDFNLDMSGEFPVPSIELTFTPYKIRNVGFDFETTIGRAGLRGEAAWTFPYGSHLSHEYIPLAQLQWVTGADVAIGKWRLIGEYSGKFLPDYYPSPVNPVLGAEQDFSQIALLMGTPGFDLQEYIRQQVGAFNRLYNYQLEEFYHSAGIRVEADLLYGILTPSFYSMYNFTSGDLYFRPEVKIKPGDGLTINIGLEYFSGRKGSLYDLVDEFMNGIFISLKADF
jgi:hypothetical protein